MLYVSNILLRNEKDTLMIPTKGFFRGFGITVMLLIALLVCAIIAFVVWWKCTTLASKRFMAERGYTYNPKDVLSVWHVYNEIYRDEDYDDVLQRLPPRPTIVDVGGNIGLFVSRCTDVCKNPTVYSFEPVPEIYQYLLCNSKKMAGDIHVFPVGLGAQDELTEIQYFPQASAMSTGCNDLDDKFKIGIQHQVKSITKSPILQPILRSLFRLYITLFLVPKQVQIQIVPLRDMMAKIPGKIDLLKIDCECYELDVLRGLTAEDFARIQTIFIEVENYRSNRSQEITQLLQKHHFHVQVGRCTNEAWCDITASRKS